LDAGDPVDLREGGIYAEDRGMSSDERVEARQMKTRREFLVGGVAAAAAVTLGGAAAPGAAAADAPKSEEPASRESLRREYRRYRTMAAVGQSTPGPDA
jgi:hypothetical protein